MKTILSILGVTFCVASGYAQYSLQDQFDQFRKQTHAEFQDFRKQVNEEYAEFVKNVWKEFETQPAVPKPKDDKVPPVVIEEEEKGRPVLDNPIVIEEEIPVPEPTPQPQPIEPIEEQPEPTIRTMKFALYGTAMEVRADENLKFSLANIDGNNLAKAWQNLSSDDYNNLIHDCLALRATHKLCDWSYLRMLDIISCELLGKGSNEAELLKAYIFCQSGYQMRLANVDGKLHMLYGSQYYIFNKPCWKIDGMFFFADKISSNRIKICEAKYPHEQAMSLAINEEQALAQKSAAKRMLAAPDIDWMKATVVEDENLMAFCNDYPTSYFGDDFMTRWALYANTPISKQAKEILYPQLRSWINDKSNAEAVDILCHWVQTAFVYEYDDKVWGHDRAFFADETLYYPYCDCEDRSILLTRIVRDLIGLSCALVYYPGHLATAIAVGEDCKGDYIRIDGVKYLICDPTYIGAPIGKTMPGMENNSAKVIVLK